MILTQVFLPHPTLHHSIHPFLLPCLPFDPYVCQSVFFSNRFLLESRSPGNQWCKRCQRDWRDNRMCQCRNKNISWDTLCRGCVCYVSLRGSEQWGIGCCPTTGLLSTRIFTVSGVQHSTYCLAGKMWNVVLPMSVWQWQTITENSSWYARVAGSSHSTKLDMCVDQGGKPECSSNSPVNPSHNKFSATWREGSLCWWG